MSARLLFLADAHLGAGDRIDDQTKVLDQVVDLAARRKVDAVIFGGDATHHRSAIREVAAFQSFVGNLDRIGIRLIAIAGNHDVSTMDAPSTVAVACEGFARATVSAYPTCETVYAGDGYTTPLATVCLLPWCPTSAIAALDPTGQVDDVVRTSTEILMDIARGLYADAKDEDPDLPVLLVLHFSMSGAVTPTGALVDEFREIVLPSHELAEIGFAAVLGGHIHSAGMVGQHAVPVLYAGSPACVDFGEADVAHGCWIIDVDEHGARCEFAPLPDRSWITVGYDHDSRSFVSSRSVEGAIVRVRYAATVDEERAIDHEQIKRDLYGAGAHRVTGIEPDIGREASARMSVTEDVSVDDALVEWLKLNGPIPGVLDVPTMAVHQEIREAVS